MQYCRCTLQKELESESEEISLNAALSYQHCSGCSIKRESEKVILVKVKVNDRVLKTLICQFSDTLTTVKDGGT